MTARIPEGMSSVETFDALYRNATFGHHYGSSDEVFPSTPWHTIQIFKSYCPNGYCDYVRGKYMFVNFSKFPELDVSVYDKYNGQGSAQKALDTYQKTMGNSHANEKFDLNCDPCTYFTSFWKQATPKHQRKDLEGMFSRCASVEDSRITFKEFRFDEQCGAVTEFKTVFKLAREDKEFKLAEALEKKIGELFGGWVFNECQAAYTLALPPLNQPPYRRYYDHNTSCQTALDHLKSLIKDKGINNTTVRRLSIDKYNRSGDRLLPDDSVSHSFEIKNMEVSLETAKKILEAQILKE